MKTSCLRNFNVWSPKSVTIWISFEKIPLPRIFRFLPVSLVVLLLLGAVAAVPVLQHFGRNTVSWSETGPVALVLAGDPGLLSSQGRRAAMPAASAIAGQLGKARRLLDACLAKKRGTLPAGTGPDSCRIRRHDPQFEPGMETGGDGKSSTPAASGRWRWIKKRFGPRKKTSNTSGPVSNGLNTSTRQDCRPAGGSRGAGQPAGRGSCREKWPSLESQHQTRWAGA